MVLEAELDLLISFSVVLIAAEIGSIVFRALRMPRVIGMLAAGVVIGPHTNPFASTIRLSAASISDLAFLGGIFLMFSIGLSFNLRNLRRIGGRALILASAAALLSFLGGYAVALSFGRSNDVAMLAGLLLTPTSSTIALRLTQEQSLLTTRGIDTTVSGIILDDVITLFFATIVLSVMNFGFHADTLAPALLGLLLVLVLSTVIVVLAFQALPRTLHLSARLAGGNPTLLALSLGFLVALAFTLVDLPPIFGAFWGGAIIASSAFGPRVREFVHPITEVFSAIFFAAVGMLIDPGALPVVGAFAVALILVAVAAKFFGGFLTLRAFRTPTVPALVCATVLVPRGEVSLVIAQFAGTPEAQSELQLLAAALTVATTLAAPLMLHGIRRHAKRRSKGRPRKAPAPETDRPLSANP